MSTPMAIINRTGQIAKAKGFTPKSLSEQADIAYNTALNMFRGVSTRIDLDVLDRICGVLNVTPGDLLVRDPQSPSDQ